MPKIEFTNDKGEKEEIDIPDPAAKVLRSEGYNDGEKKTIDRFTGIINDNEALKALSGDSKTMRDQMGKIANELTRLQAQPEPDQTELTEMRTKLSQMEATLGESEAKAAKTVKIEGLRNAVKGHMISLGLGKEYQDDTEYFIGKHFEIEENANGDYVFVFSKDKKVFLHEGEPAQPLHVGEWFAKEKPGWFQQQRGGLGLNGKTVDQGTTGGPLPLTASTDDLLSRGLKREVSRPTA